LFCFVLFCFWSLPSAIYVASSTEQPAKRTAKCPFFSPVPGTTSTTSTRTGSASARAPRWVLNEGGVRAAAAGLAHERGQRALAPQRVLSPSFVRERRGVGLARARPPLRRAVERSSSDPHT
jgi:hypothetical protein